jgi:cell division protein FtsL
MNRKKQMRNKQGESVTPSQRNRKRTQNHYGFFLFIGFILFIFHLWGKVQIDFEYRKNQKFNADKLKLEEEIKQLRVQIHSLESYQRITEQAARQGMVFLSPSQIRELPVDLEGIKSPVETGPEKIWYATLFPDRLK